MVSACDNGGGNSGGDGGGGGGGSASESKSTEGRVTGFGSVIVGGVRFDVDSAVMMNNDTAITEGDLRAGMLVRLTGSVNQETATGVASTLNFSEQLRGPVSSVNVDAESFIALGQTIFVDDETIFHGVTLETLEADSSVLVSGYFDAKGDVRASMVELKSAAAETAEEIRIEGMIEDLDVDAQEFMLRAQLVSYTSAELSGVPDGTLSNGMVVDVVSTQSASGEVLIAEKINYKKDDAEEGDRLRLEGLVTDISSATEFKVNGRSVILADTAIFDVGAAANISLNTRINVEGEINAQGVLVAEQAKLRRRGHFLINTVIDEVDAEANAMVAMGVTVSTTATTSWKDDSDASDRHLSLGRLGAGDRVEVKGYQNASGEFVATSVGRANADSEALHRFRGPIADLENVPSFTLFGITVSTDATTEFESSASSSSILASSQFFTDLELGSIVEIKGTVSGSSTIQAKSVKAIGDDNRDEFGGDK